MWRIGSADVPNIDRIVTDLAPTSKEGVVSNLGICILWVSTLCPESRRPETAATHEFSMESKGH
jgi:hypothetical protein